jgi:hypothetical protein
MHKSMPSSRARVLHANNTATAQQQRHGCKAHQTLRTIAVWSNDLALPFRIPCSAIVLSECTTTRRPRSWSLNVDKPGQYINRSQHSHSMGGGLTRTIRNREHLQRGNLIIIASMELLQDLIRRCTVCVADLTTISQENCAYAWWGGPEPRKSNTSTMP